jgi:PAS domain S-box-containing protein
MLGYTDAELQRLSFLDITHENYLEANRTLIGELLEGKRKQFQIEKKYRRKDGKSIWVRNNVSIVSGTERGPRSSWRSPKTFRNVNRRRPPRRRVSGIFARS